jgi:hypothetical protein
MPPSGAHACFCCPLLSFSGTPTVYTCCPVRPPAYASLYYLTIRSCVSVLDRLHGGEPQGVDEGAGLVLSTYFVRVSCVWSVWATLYAMFVLAWRAPCLTLVCVLQVLALQEQ